jgi:hypothetical protein
MVEQSQHPEGDQAEPLLLSSSQRKKHKDNNNSNKEKNRPHDKAPTRANARQASVRSFTASLADLLLFLPHILSSACAFLSIFSIPETYNGKKRPYLSHVCHGIQKLCDCV